MSSPLSSVSTPEGHLAITSWSLTVSDVVLDGVEASWCPGVWLSKAGLHSPNPAPPTHQGYKIV